MGQDLIERIETGTIFTIHDCVIMCSSPEDKYTVVDTLPSESIETIWGSIGGFHAFLTPDQIFSNARMDEVGTPFCVTVDHDTLKDKTVTIRDRDTTKQERKKIDDIVGYLKDKIFN